MKSIEQCAEYIANVLYVDGIKINVQDLKEIIEGDINFNGGHTPTDDELRDLVFPDYGCSVEILKIAQNLKSKFPDTYGYLSEIM